MNKKRHSATVADPRKAEALFEKGRILLSQGKVDEAVSAWEKVAALAPKDPAAHCNLGCLYFRRGESGKAIPCFQKAVLLNPRYAQAWCNLGAALRQAGKYQQAVDSFISAIDIQPGYAIAHANLAECYEAGNRMEDAHRHAEKALSLDVNQPVAQLVRARIDFRAKRIDAAHERLNSILGAALQPDLRSHALKLLGRVLEKMQRFDEAYHAFLESKTLLSTLPESRAVDKTAYPAMLGHIRSWVKERQNQQKQTATLSHRPGGQTGPPAPVFVVGFPRSGTTLTEQILSSHPDLVSSDERPLLDAVVDVLRPKHDPSLVWTSALRRPSELDWDALRALYWQKARENSSYVPGSGRFVDKLPLNIVHLGLIERLFPGAHVLVILRDPRDVCLSAFQQDFAPNEAMVHLSTLESTAAIYEKVMGLYLAQRSRLSVASMEVRYEDLVRELEESVRRILSFLGLPFDPAVLRYHEKAKNRHISTPSYEAVTEPVHTASIGRWKKYASVMETVRARLSPFVQAFDYGAWQ